MKLENRSRKRWLMSLIRAIGIPLIRLFYRLRAVHSENIPVRGGVLLLPNHVTFADAFYISAGCPRPVRFVMDEAFMADKTVAWFCSVFDTLTIRKDQPREAIRLTIAALAAGEAVCFFPEGQLSRTGTLNEIRRGIELIAKKSGAPMVPVWLDGAWGSIFSFERGRFFKKWPYRLPYGMTVNFGRPLSPEADLETIRNAMMRTAAEALSIRFPNNGSVAEINGYQIGQAAGIPRRCHFAALLSDPLVGRLPALFDEFSGQFGSRLELENEIGGNLRIWVGGDELRAALEVFDGVLELDFFDFGMRALRPLEKAGIRHFPCLAIDGRVIAMSMPDPPRAREGSEIQRGTKPRSWGKMLPGWFVERSADGALRVKGPAAGEEGLQLPGEAFLDDEGFVAIRG